MRVMTKAVPIRRESVHSMLRIGKSRIAVGRAAEVAALVLARPKAFPRLVECLWDDDPATARRAAHVLEAWLEEGGSSIVKTMALQGLVDLTRQNHLSPARVLDLVRLQGRSGTAAMRARCRLLLEKLEKKSGPEPK